MCEILFMSVVKYYIRYSEYGWEHVKGITKIFYLIYHQKRKNCEFFQPLNIILILLYISAKSLSLISVEIY